MEEIVRTHLFDLVHSHPRRLANLFGEKVQLVGQRPIFLGLTPDALYRLLGCRLDLPLDVLFEDFFMSVLVSFFRAPLMNPSPP